MGLHQHIGPDTVNLTSLSQVKSWCIENGFHPNKVLGQNFLIDRNTLEAIADAALDGVPAGAEVLEVGPGLGVLTEELLKRGCRVTAVEKDRALASRLAHALGEVLGVGLACLVLLLFIFLFGAAVFAP